MEYIATFYTHFGAVRLNRQMKEEGIRSKMMPVPRNLSSSCGTCVWFETQPDQFPHPRVPREIEQIVRITPDGYEAVFEAEDD